jgi:hypothetical protein
MKLEYTWRIIDAIHDGSLLETEYELTPIFNLAVPTKVKSVRSEVLHPENLVSKVLTFLLKALQCSLMWICIACCRPLMWMKSFHRQELFLEFWLPEPSHRIWLQLSGCSDI